MVLETLKTFSEVETLEVNCYKEYETNFNNYITIFRNHIDTLCDYYNNDEGKKLDIAKEARVLIYYMQWAFEKAVDIYHDAIATAEITYKYANNILDIVTVDDKENINSLFRTSCNFLVEAYQNYTAFTNTYPELVI